MSNSSLVSYTRLSPNHSGRRTHAIDRISPHCVVGQCSVETIGNIFANPAYNASSQYGIGSDGRIGQYVYEENRSWCTSSMANDQRAVTIECASDTTEPYWMNDKVYQSLIKLCVDICRRNGKKKLLWFNDKNKSLSYNPKSDEMVITVHRWFANKSCPGNWLYARLGDLAYNVTKILGGATQQPAPAPTPTPSKPTTGGNSNTGKKQIPTITYAIRTRRSGILPDVKDGAVAGRKGEPAIAIKIGVSVGQVKYRVHCGGRWLPPVTGNNWNDYNNGYAGDNKSAIDAIQIYYTSDRNKTDVYEAVYCVKPVGFSNYLAKIYDTNWENSDGARTAGIFGKPFDELKIQLSKC